MHNNLTDLQLLSCMVIWNITGLGSQSRTTNIVCVHFSDISVTTSLELSLAEFRDEEAWLQLQLGVYNKIIDL